MSLVFSGAAGVASPVIPGRLAPWCHTLSAKTSSDDEAARKLRCVATAAMVVVMEVGVT